MGERKKQKIPELELGALPVAKINAALEMELEAGNVVFSAGAQVHAQRRHPIEYPLVLPHLGAMIANPLYIGDDLKNDGCIELISRVASANSMVLVAINVERDEDGRYHVLSLYTVKAATIENRRQKGYLIVAPNV